MKIYAKYLDNAALEQFNSAMEQDFVVDGALMPDAHKGYALPIGAVVSTKDVIVPAWVGYDIGCGMSAIKLTELTKKQVIDNKTEIFDEIYKKIPVGFNVNETGSDSDLDIYGLTEEVQKIAIKKKWQQSLGSLGGGKDYCFQTKTII